MGGIFSDERENETVSSVDISKYLGLWYEIARKPFDYEDNYAYNITAEYIDRGDGWLTVVNKEMVNGYEKKSVGEAYAADETNAKLRVSFFFGFFSDYRIIILDKNYRYSVVTNKDGSLMWVLSRNPTLNNLDEILRQVEEKGVNTANLIFCKHF